MPDAVAQPPITLQSTLAPGLAAVRKYWRPFLLLQAAASLLVISYFTSGQVRDICRQLSDFRQHAGFVFSAVSAAFAGALLPEIAKIIMMGDRVFDQKRLRDIGFALVIFAGIGIIIDAQYRVFALLLGNENHVSTIAAKVLLDQFVTTPIYGVPYFPLLYCLRARRYNVLATARLITPRWYATRAMPLLIPGWCYWIPMVSLIYSLPGPLQFFLFDFALAAWSLLIVFISVHEPGGIVSTPAA